MACWRAVRNTLHLTTFAEDMSKKLLDGIKLPKILDFTPTYTTVTIERGLFVVGTDFCSQTLGCSKEELQSNKQEESEEIPDGFDYYEYPE